MRAADAGLASGAGGVPRSGGVALIGDPVGHSLSPAMQRAAFDATALAWTYEAVRVTREELPEAWPALAARYAGLNVTIPLKEDVARLVDRRSPAAEATGSVNTVVFARTARAGGLSGDPGDPGVPAGAGGAGGAGESFGDSTDGEGFMAALLRAVPAPPRRAVVLGTGGAARAVAHALAAAGAEVLVAGRNADAGRRLAADLGTGVGFIGADPREALASLGAGDLLANATPVGGVADPAGSPLPEGTPLRPGLVVFDLVYRPRRTALLRRAEAAGCVVVEGVEMLIEQGARSFALWTGREAPLDAMRAAARIALAEPADPPDAGAGTDTRAGTGTSR